MDYQSTCKGHIEKVGIHLHINDSVHLNQCLCTASTAFQSCCLSLYESDLNRQAVRNKFICNDLFLDEYLLW